MFRLQNQLSRFGLLGAGLVMLTLFTTLGGLWNYQSQLADQLSSAQLSGKGAKQAVPRQIANNGTGVLSQAAAAGPITQTGAGKPAVTVSQTAAPGAAPSGKTTGATNQPVAAPQAADVSLSLSINGQLKGTVILPAGSNQCDVLTQALTSGLISSLDMRYSSQYGTEAVYVIDGTGDPSSVWWTYTVNGRAPPYGCAYVTVHNGDSVSWKYIKS